MSEVIILGILVSIVFYELTDISPGGIVVPGILVAYVHQIDRLIYTAVVAVLTYAIVKLFSKYFIVYGKRKYVLMIIVSLIINFFFGLIVRMFTINMLNVSIVGYIVSGLIAYEISKQGTVKTLSALTIVVAFLQLLLFVLGAIGILI